MGKCRFLGTEFCKKGRFEYDSCRKNLAKNYYSKKNPAGCYRTAEKRLLEKYTKIEILNSNIL